MFFGCGWIYRSTLPPVVSCSSFILVGFSFISWINKFHRFHKFRLVLFVLVVVVAVLLDGGAGRAWGDPDGGWNQAASFFLLQLLLGKYLCNFVTLDVVPWKMGYFVFLVDD